MIDVTIVCTLGTVGLVIHLSAMSAEKVTSDLSNADAALGGSRCNPDNTIAPLEFTVEPIYQRGCTAANYCRAGTFQRDAVE